MSQLRKVRRAMTTAEHAEANSSVKAWAKRSYSRYGERAVAIAVQCRSLGLRDFLIKVSDIEECMDGTFKRRMPLKPKCQHGGMYDRAGAMTRPCGAEAVLLTITDSGLELFLCEEHAEERVVWVPT